MPAPLHAPPRARRTLSPFTVTLRSPGRVIRYTALARSSGEALGHALALPGLTPPVAASVSPLELYRRKLALADLVEGV